MPKYDIYFRDTKVATITPVVGKKQRYTLDIFGIHYFDWPEEDVLISCNLADVRVTRDGEDCTVL